jgi:hypothetical protein
MVMYQLQNQYVKSISMLKLYGSKKKCCAIAKGNSISPLWQEALKKNATHKMNAKALS